MEELERAPKYFASTMLLLMGSNIVVEAPRVKSWGGHLAPASTKAPCFNAVVPLLEYDL